MCGLCPAGVCDSDPPGRACAGNVWSRHAHEVCASGALIAEVEAAGAAASQEAVAALHGEKITRMQTVSPPAHCC